MTKTIVDIDDNLLRRAMSATGSTTKKQTITEALELTVRRAAAARYIEDLKAGLVRDLDDPEVVQGAQR